MHACCCAVHAEHAAAPTRASRLLKERSAEDHLFGDKDKFVTAAYKKKLEEDQKWLAEERVREAKDARSDAIKAGHMGNFYR
jgi:coiled-coil domain-containing protein 55